MSSIYIPKAEMQELIYDSSVIVRERIINKRRWSYLHEVIFKRDGKLYRTVYSSGATENQDEQPYEYDNKDIECKEVREVPAIDYEVIP